jgi:hypothetical protein
MDKSVSRLPTNYDRLSRVRVELDKLKEASFTAAEGRWMADDTEIYGSHLGVWVANVESKTDVEDDAYCGDHIAAWNPDTTTKVLNVLEAVLDALEENGDEDRCFHSSVLEPGCVGCLKDHLWRVLSHELKDLGPREL